MAGVAQMQNLMSDGKILSEFGKVCLLKDIVYHGLCFSKGSIGTIVEIHDRGAGYEIEFTKPAEEVVGVRREDLVAL